MFFVSLPWGLGSVGVTIGVALHARGTPGKNPVKQRTGAFSELLELHSFQNRKVVYLVLAYLILNFNFKSKTQRWVIIFHIILEYDK